MKITINTTAVLDLLGQDGEHWTQGSWEEGNSMCLHGAIRKCQPQLGDAHLVQQVADRQGWGISFNDNAEGWGDVKKRILHGLEVTDEDLADIYGPNWRYVVTLVRQAASLTAEQVESLKAVRTAVRGAAWVVGRNAARNAAGDAAWGAVRGVVRGAAEGWTRDAASALVVRDLITPEQYQTLAGPWESVMGEIKEIPND